MGFGCPYTLFQSVKAGKTNTFDSGKQQFIAYISARESQGTSRFRVSGGLVFSVSKMVPYSCI